MIKVMATMIRVTTTLRTVTMMTTMTKMTIKSAMMMIKASPASYVSLHHNTVLQPSVFPFPHLEVSRLRMNNGDKVMIISCDLFDQISSTEAASRRPLT